MFFVFKYDNSEEKTKKNYQVLFFTLRNSTLINESITLFGYSVQSSQINCSSAWCFLHTNFWHFEHFAGQYLVDSKNTLYFVDCSYLQSTWLAISSFIAAKPFPFQSYKLFQNLLVWYRHLAKWFLCSSNKCQDKRKCIQGPRSRFYLCWMCCWQKIDNIYASFCVIIHCVYAGPLLLVFCDFDIIMRGWRYNYILLTTFFYQCKKQA